MRITRRKLRKIIREAIDQAACDPSNYSLAWVSPEGKTYFLASGEEHGDWAKKYTDKLHDTMEIDYDRLDSDPEYEGLVEKHYDWATDEWDQSYLDTNPEAVAFIASTHHGGPVGLLLTEGWVKMTNGFTFAAHPMNKLHPAAVTAIVDIVVDCIVARKQNPEEQNMFIEEYSEHGLVPSDRFLTPAYSKRLRGGSGYFGSRHLIGADAVRQPTVADFVQRYGTEVQQEKMYSSL